MRISVAFFVVAAALTGCALPLPTAATPNSPSGAVLFQDDFSSPASGWNRTQAAQGIMDYFGGAYRVQVNASQTNFWSTPHKDLTNVRLEVDAGKLGGPDENRVGLICRSDGKSYYFFIIGSDGYYGLGYYQNGQASLLGQSSMQPNAAIHAGTAVNHLRMDCIGDQLSAYVNGVRLAEVHDPSLSHGDIGVLAGTFDKPGTDIVFDNFVALQP